jgi:hypothetical protein
MFIRVGVIYHLHNAPLVTQIKKNDTAMIPAPIYPTAQSNRFINIICAQSATIMTAHNLDSVWISWPDPQWARN